MSLGERGKDEEEEMVMFSPLLCIFLILAFAFDFSVVFGTCNLDFQASLQDDVLRLEPVRRLKQLGNISDAKNFLQRTFLSPASIEAGKLIQEWMRDAGLVTWIDHIGNVHGRANGANANAPAILLGSHLDTVIDAGRYDGALGIVSAIAAVKALHISRKLDIFPRPIEVIAFSDEEGVRFQSTFLGSRALSGNFPLNLLYTSDKSGITLQTALQSCSFDGTEDSLLQLKYDANSIWGYVELHIEQGPLLENLRAPVGVVSTISGQTRLSVTVQGSQGHAGTVPMAMRRDPMPAAAEAIVYIDYLCNHPDLYLKGYWEQDQYNHLISESGLVCTVGEIISWPGASNVIPGQVKFTIDVRAQDDPVRASTVFNIERKIHEICRARGVLCNIEHKHEANAVQCSPEFQNRLQTAAASAVQRISSFEGKSSPASIPSLVSGAGHDAMVMAQLTKIGMIFVRCTGGISHSPAEHVTETDIWAASLALKEFLEDEIQISDHDNFNLASI